MSPGCLSSLSGCINTTSSSSSAAMPGASKRGVGSKVKQACRRIEQLVIKPTTKPGEPEPIDAFLNNGPQAPNRPPPAPPLPIQNAAPESSPLAEKYKIPYSAAFSSDPRASSVQNEQRRVNKIARGYVRPQDTIAEEDTPPPVPPKVSTSLSLPLGKTFAIETEQALHHGAKPAADGLHTRSTGASSSESPSSQRPRPNKRQRSRSRKVQRKELDIDVPDTVLENDQHSPFSFMIDRSPAFSTASSKRPKSLHVRSHTAEELHFDAGPRLVLTQAKSGHGMYGEFHALRAGRPGHKRASTQHELGQNSHTAAPWKVYAPKETRLSQHTPFNPKAAKQGPEERQTTSAIFGIPQTTEGKSPRIASGILSQETGGSLKNMFSDVLDNPAQLESMPKTATARDALDCQHVRASSYRPARYRSPGVESVPDETIVPTAPIRPPPVIPTRLPYPVTPTGPQPEHSRQSNTNCSQPYTGGARVMQARAQTVKRTQARKVSIRSQGSQKSEVKVDRLAAPLPMGHTTHCQPSVEGDVLPRMFGFRGDEAATEHRRRYEERRRLRREKRQQEEQEREQREAQRRWEEVNDGDLIDFRSVSQETSSVQPNLQATVDQAFVFWARQEASLLD